VKVALLCGGVWRRAATKAERQGKRLRGVREAFRGSAAVAAAAVDCGWVG